MKTLRNLIVPIIAGVFMVALALNFNACTEQSPLQPSDKKVDGSIITLAKKAKQSSNTASTSTSYETQPSGDTSTYPQFASLQINFKGMYDGGNVNVPNGSTFHLTRGALIPPPGTPHRESVTITMLVEKDDIQNELIFSFGPSGTQFNPPAEVWFDWSDLDTEQAKLFYINDNGDYVEQQPDDVDMQGQRMKLIIDHFSRYAVAWSR